MPTFQRADIGALASALSSAPLEVPQSDKGRFFKFTWWPAHHAEVEEKVLKAVADDKAPAFDRRVNILDIARKVDLKNGSQLDTIGFTPTELTHYVTKAMNQRLKQIANGSPVYYVIRNQRLIPLQVEHKPAE